MTQQSPVDLTSCKNPRAPTTFAAIILLVAAHGFAHSAPVLIDFEEQPIGSRSDNFVSRGFIFSPNCHYDLIDSYNGSSGLTPAPFGNWLGFDVGGSCDNNPNYLGPTGVPFGGLMYVASEAGRRFNLDSFVFATVSDNEFGVDVYSSKGGMTSISASGGNFIEYSFTGSDWRNIDWLVFSTRIAGAPAGFDNLRLNLLSSPSTLWLLLGTLPVAVRRASRPVRPSEA